MVDDSYVQYLSIIAAQFSALSALFGVYIVLFILAISSTYRRNEKSHVRLRTVTIILFLILCTHYVNRSLTLWRARVLIPASDQLMTWIIPMTFIGGITTTLAGFVSDGLLAWRFYVIHDRRPWALYIPAGAIIINALLGLSGDVLPLLVYHDTQLYENHLQITTFQITAAWGWVMFVINSLLTGSILWRIIYISRSSSKTSIFPLRHSAYGVVTEAIVESAFVNWFGILLYEIASFAPHGKVTADLDVGFVMVCILPIFFGISQCLITARLGFGAPPSPSTIVVDIKNPGGPHVGSSHSTSSTSRTLMQEVSIKVEKDVEVVTVDGPFYDERANTPSARVRLGPSVAV